MRTAAFVHNGNVDAAASPPPAPADARKFSLNLSGLQQEMTPGDHVPGSARKPGRIDDGAAHTHVRHGARRARCGRCGSPSTGRSGWAARVKPLGSPAVRCLRRPKGRKAATAVVHAERLDAALAQPRPGRPTYCDLTTRRDGGGDAGGDGHLPWDQPYRGPDAPPDEAAAGAAVVPSITEATSFCAWSKMAPQLAIGTTQGKVIIFNKGESVMQLHEKKGKHGAPVTCGDWLFDNRLGLASGLRVKISQPIAETASKWESYSKFQLGGMLSRVPRKFKTAGAPKLLSFSLSYPPFVALCIGDYMLVFGTSSAKVDEDVGLTFPEDWLISGFQWLEDNMMLVALRYVTTVDFGAMVRMRQTQGSPSA